MPIYLQHVEITQRLRKKKIGHGLHPAHEPKSFKPTYCARMDGEYKLYQVLYVLQRVQDSREYLLIIDIGWTMECYEGIFLRLETQAFEDVGRLGPFQVLHQSVDHHVSGKMDSGRIHSFLSE